MQAYIITHARVAPGVPQGLLPLTQYRVEAPSAQAAIDALLAVYTPPEAGEEALVVRRADVAEAPGPEIYKPVEGAQRWRR